MRKGSWADILSFYANGVPIELQITMEAFDRMSMAYLSWHKRILIE